MYLCGSIFANYYFILKCLLFFHFHFVRMLEPILKARDGWALRVNILAQFGWIIGAIDMQQQVG